MLGRGLFAGNSEVCGLGFGAKTRGSARHSRFRLFLPYMGLVLPHDQPRLYTYIIYCLV